MVTASDGSAAPVPASSPTALELAVFSGEEIRTFPLPRIGKVTIGRGEGSTVRIDDPSVSRHHAVLHLDQALEIEDLGGANGTIVRPKVEAGSGDDTVDTVSVVQLVRRKATLAVGDCLLFGTASAVVRHRPVIEIPDLVSEDPDGAGTAAGIVLRDPAMRALHAQAARAARTNISVLLLGETGVGKEVLARAIHAHSPRSKGPFLGINCAAIAESLLESELFGSEKGAFTGALAARAGLFEAGNGGTVFLDEIGDLPLATQAKLLRVLEERAVTRVGSTRPRPIDVRFVAATNRYIEADSRVGRFRQDLYFRLAGITLTIPPLRDRPAEISLLVEKFVKGACGQVDRAAPLVVSREAFDCLAAHAWPGNVRELRNVIERATVLCMGDRILPEHLPPSVLSPIRPSTPPAVTPSAPTDLQDEIKSLERTRIVEALARCHGNQSQAAAILGISRRTLVSRLTAFGLPRPRKWPNDAGT
jgi:DNA-binding NtrC family response regulator